MRKWRWFVVVACVAMATRPDADAQITRAPSPGTDFVELPELTLPMEVVSMQAVDQGPPIVGSPFSAETAIDVVQVLGDGNRIRRRFTGRLFRDSAGRTRREHALATIGALVPSDATETVVISDPPAGVSIMLDPETRTATRMPLMQIDRAERPSASHARPPRRAMPLRRLDIARESLGESVESGILATGTRTTTVLPAGLVGNEQPIRIVHETWRSEALRVLVASRRVDPRFAETRYRLTSIVQAEPPPEVFQIPPGYGVRDVDPLRGRGKP